MSLGKLLSQVTDQGLRRVFGFTRAVVDMFRAQLAIEPDAFAALLRRTRGGQPDRSVAARPFVAQHGFENLAEARQRALDAVGVGPARMHHVERETPARI